MLGRVSFNFLAKCNMQCEYCYIPFGGTETDPALWLAIVDRLHSVGVRSVTFGGGDPFKYRGFRELLTQSRSLFEFIQVDTNGYGLRDADVALLSHSSDLVGIPLDGPSASIHGEMRGDARHFEVARTAAVKLQAAGIPLKINTVVAKPNVGAMDALATLIAEISPKIWSVYEFWPIGPIAVENKHKFILAEGEFELATLRASVLAAGVAIELGPVSARRAAYFFVGNDGNCYTINKEAASEYAPIGSVFDDATIQRWFEYGYDLENQARVARRRSLLDCNRAD